MIAMGFLLIIGAAFLLLLVVAGILVVGVCAVAAGGAGFWWWRSRKAKVAPIPEGRAPATDGPVADQDSRSGR